MCVTNEGEKINTDLRERHSDTDVIAPQQRQQRRGCHSEPRQQRRGCHSDVLVALICLSVSTRGSAVRLLDGIMLDWLHRCWFITDKHNCGWCKSLLKCSKESIWIIKAFTLCVLSEIFPFTRVKATAALTSCDVSKRRRHGEGDVNSNWHYLLFCLISTANFDFLKRNRSMWYTLIPFLAESWWKDRYHSCLCVYVWSWSQEVTSLA